MTLHETWRDVRGAERIINAIITLGFSEGLNTKHKQCTRCGIKTDE